MPLDRDAVVGRSLPEHLRDRAESQPDHGLLVHGGGELSYGEMHERSERLASALLDLGISPGDHVALLMDNSPEIILTWFALAKIGAVEVPINTAFRGASLEYLLNHCDASFLVASPDLLEAPVRIADRLEHLEHVVVAGDTAMDVPWESTALADLESAGGPTSPTYPDPDALMAVMYTSGTTGHPKGVMESHRCAMHWGVNYATYMAVTSSDTNYLFPPLFHAMSQFMGVVPAVLTGSRFAIRKGFSASNFWDDCRRDDVTLFNFTGGVLSFLWKQPPRDDDADNPVTRALGVPIPDDLYPGFEERFGLELLPPFGTSESNVVCYSRSGQVRRGSSGQAIPEFEVQVVDDVGDPVPVGTTGEIVTRPRHADSMMRGYYKRPDATVAAFRDLWYHTGDLGRMDEDGYLYFVDRKKDAIRRRGENISSFELERVIDRHPSILESVAVGVPSEHGEEEVKLAVVLRTGAVPITPQELWRYCEEELPAFMVPRFLEIREHLPKTPTERVRKFVIRDEGIHDGVFDRDLMEGRS